MAQVTFTIPDAKIQYFIDAFGDDYDLKVSKGVIDGGAISKAQYAKSQAFKHLADYVRDWKYNQDLSGISPIDITE